MHLEAACPSLDCAVTRPAAVYSPHWRRGQHSGAGRKCRSPHAGRANTHNLTQPEKRRRLAVLLEQRRHRRRLGHDLLFDAGRPPPRHAEEEERREEVEAEAEGDAPKMPALL